MTKDYERKHELVREHIESADGISERDRKLLLDFDDEMALRPSDFAMPTRYKTLQYCSMMAGDSPGLGAEELPDVDLHKILEDRSEAEDLVRWVHDRYDNEESDASFRRVIRTFGRVVTEGDEAPESLEWIPTKLSNTYDPAPDPSEMIHWEETLELIDHTFNARDAALLAVAWDAGCRGGEMHSLTVGNVTDHKHGLRITVQGKTGQRTITLIPSVPYLQRWLEEHPDSDDSDVPLWSKLGSAEDISYETLWKCIKRAGERAGLQKPVNFTNFRKSSASYLASQGMSQSHLEEHHGWKRGSDVAGRYVAVFGDAAENELAQIHGIDISEDTSEPVGPVDCTRCNQQTPRERDFCIHCNQALDREADDLLDRFRELLDEKAIDSSDPDVRKKAVEARRTAEDKPAAVEVDELHELVSSLED